MKKELFLHYKTHFSAAHQLGEIMGKCNRLHGHTWKVHVIIRTVGKSPKWEMDGIVVDFGEIKEIVETPVTFLDHSNLNDNKELLPFPTAEIIGRWLWEKIEKEIERRNFDSLICLAQVEVWESDACGVTIQEEKQKNKKIENPSNQKV